MHRIADWLRETLLGRDDRAARYYNPGMVAYYWDGGAPKAHALKDISSTGAYVYAKELWCIGTIITLTLQMDAAHLEQGSPVPFVVMRGRIVRYTPDGAGIQFMLSREEERRALRKFLYTAGLNESPGRNGFGGAGGNRGQALVELAVAVPILFLLTALAFNFGTWLYGWVAIGNAARAAGDYAIMGGAYATLPTAATSSTLQSLINTELTYLPNTSSSNPKACIRQNFNGTYTTLMQMPSGACASYSNPPADPEPTSYVSVAVDITYTYTSFFTGSKVLGLPMTVLPSTIHRRTVMRMIQ
ncbi:MAG: pilus assembly protein [Acidobacteriaceae bacterium]|nr:pilus assembly protein [Acidobacteriaceae bacterium]MBV9497801.1 pilus assembly protein [Acidobacteriaceae bacterium]